ncbi:Tetratricopeptide-like helical, partial [Metarhizium majus ARSEF 297]
MAVRRVLSPGALIRPSSASIIPIPSKTHIHPSTIQRLQKTQSFASRSAPKAPSYTDVFTLSDIPLSSFESVISRNGSSFTDLSPEEYYRVAQKFSDAINRGSSPWTSSFAGKDAIPAETLHEVACIMRQVTGPRSADAFATALWSTASEMGYRPSTLSLARQLVRSGAYGRVPQLRRVEARFKGLVSSGKDADALTAEGELLLQQGRLDAAAAVLTKALRLSPRFEWRPYCRLCLGRAYLKMGKVDDARGLFEKLAQEGVVEADMELAEMLRGSDADEARQRMYTAACNGRRDMFTRLSEMELELEAVGGEKDGEERRLWAMEWSKLADGRVEY